MFTNWLNNTYIIWIICPSNFCWEYCSHSNNHFTNNYTIFLTSVFLCWARSLFILKLLPRILPSMFLTSIHCLVCLLLLWLDGSGLLAAAASLSAWHLCSATILTIIFIRAISFIFYNKWFCFFNALFIISGSFFFISRYCCAKVEVILLQLL